MVYFRVRVVSGAFPPDSCGGMAGTLGSNCGSSPEGECEGPGEDGTQDRIERG